MEKTIFTTVFNLSTGDTAVFSLPPREAVRAAHAILSTRGGGNTWLLGERFPLDEVVEGRWSVAYGDWSALKDGMEMEEGEEAGMSIKTNYRPRALVNRWDVPEEVLADQFDWADGVASGFFQYGDNWYNVKEFMACAIPGWDRIHSESAFSGVLLKLVDSETVIVGRYLD